MIWAYSSAVEQPAHNRLVPGSIPGGPTIGAISSAGRAPALQAGCRRFDPVIAHHKKKPYLFADGVLCFVFRERSRSKVLNVSERIKQLAKMTPRGSKVADIGTDHGLLPCYLVLEGIAPYVIAADQRSGPLRSAEKNVKAYGCVDKVDLRLGAGLKVLSPGEVSTLILAGLGGKTIKQILCDAPEISNNVEQIICQPMNAAAEVRFFIEQSGWMIDNEELIFEDGRIYEFISAKKGMMPKMTRAEALYGPLLLGSRHRLLSWQLEKDLKALQEILIQLTKSTTSSSKHKYAEFMKKEKMIKELLECLSAAKK